MQSGFYTPAREGELWDTWVVYHEGVYHQYYTAGPYAAWVGHDLAVSDDGVHWRERGRIVDRRQGVTMLGSGHVWKAPDFESSRRWIANYSEWVGALDTGKQDIVFLTSTDLMSWTKADGRLRFVQDARWYRESGRWDCIDAIERPEGGLYGYFTANPEPDRVGYRPAGFGFAQSADGLRWEALPPVPGDVDGDFGGIQKIGDSYYALISHFPGHGRVAVSRKPEGPFTAQKKNFRLFGRQEESAACFPRFIHNAPDGPLVNHHYMDGTPHSAPFKAVEVDTEGVLRLMWWRGNEALKHEKLEISFGEAKRCGRPMLVMNRYLDLEKVVAVEGRVVLDRRSRAARRNDVSEGSSGASSGPGLFFEGSEAEGRCVLFAADAALFGRVVTGKDRPVDVTTVGQDLGFGQDLRFRVVAKRDMMECYVNDYLTMVKRVPWNGRLALMPDRDGPVFRDIRVWQSR